MGRGCGRLPTAMCFMLLHFGEPSEPGSRVLRRGWREHLPASPVGRVVDPCTNIRTDQEVEVLDLPLRLRPSGSAELSSFFVRSARRGSTRERLAASASDPPPRPYR